MKNFYYETVLLTGRSHRYFLEVLKLRLDEWGLPDINGVQALVLYNIGRDEMTVGELTARGYYLGSNVSYNVKEMSDNGYLEQNRSPHDRRSVRIKLSAKGLELHGKLEALMEEHAKGLSASGISAEEIGKANDTMRKLEKFWTAQISGTQALARGA